MIEKMCRECGRTFFQYNTAVTLCQLCSFNKYNKPNKPLKVQGRRTKEYDKWRITVAIPYLDNKYGHVCSECGVGGALDIDHIKPRGSRPDLKMELTNVRYLCRKCHIKRT